MSFISEREDEINICELMLTIAVPKANRSASYVSCVSWSALSRLIR